jgi:hypothetical protein
MSRPKFASACDGDGLLLSSCCTFEGEDDGGIFRGVFMCLDFYQFTSSGNNIDGPLGEILDDKQ